MTDFGLVVEPSATYTAPLAKRIEAMGFGYFLAPDTQNLCADPYGQLNLAAVATTKLRIGTGVTNPITRDSAVTAGALATMQVESGGRVICGIGRGDSSAAHIGKKQATGKQMSDYVHAIRTYIAGGVVDRDGTPSAIRWIKPGDIPPVIIDMACTGPKTIQLAADIADRVSFAVGSNPERIQWAMDVFNARMAENGRDRNSVSVGAYVNLVCDNDKARAISLARTCAGLVAHFSGMEHSPTEHLPGEIKDYANTLKSQYDMAHHGQEEGTHLQLIDEEFIQWIAIVGGPNECIDKLGHLINDIGLQHISLLGGSPVAQPHGPRVTGAVDTMELFAEKVLPAFKS